MSPAGATLRSIIGSARHAVRKDAKVAIAAAVFTVIPVVMLVTWLLSLTTDIAHRLPLAIDLAAVSLSISVSVLLFRRWLARVDDAEVARHAESQFGLAEGQLRTVLEMHSAPAGTSQALLRREENNLASRLGGADPVALAGALGRRTQSRRTRALAVAAALCAAVTLLAFAAPERSRASWQPLLRPVRTIVATALPPIRLEPGSTTVPRGTSVEIDVVAPRRDLVVLHWRERGDVLNELPVTMIDSVAAVRINAVHAELKYWATAPDGAVSDTFTITPIDPLLISALTIDVVYPAYLQRAADRFEKDTPPLELPMGTELRIHGRSTQPVAAVSLEYGTASTAFSVDGSAFSGVLRPRESGVYEWKLTSSNGIAESAAPAPLEIKVIADAPPVVEVTYPGIDTLMPPDMKQLIVADAVDDHGVTSAIVVSWRTSMNGGRDAFVEQPLSLEGEPDRKLVRGVLDATSRRLLPGDTLSYFVRVTDNAPSHQSSVSRTFTLRVPGMEEMRERAQDQANSLVEDAGALARAMKQLETYTRDLQRKSASAAARTGERGTGGSPGGERQMRAEQVQQAAQVLERQKAMTAELEKLRDRIETVERTAEQAGLRDPELQKRLDELKQLYDELLSPELKKQLQDLQKALEALDPEQVRKALEDLAKRQAEMRAQLDRSLELMRKAAAEQEMSKLSQEAKELAAQQQALSEEMKSGEADARDTAVKQKELQKKTTALGDLLSKLKNRLNEQGENTASGKTGDAEQQTDQAAQAQTDAAQEAARKQGEKAGDSAQKAADKLSEAARTLEDARSQMTASWKKDVREAVDNATQDAINLAQKQKELLDRMKPQPSASAQMGRQQEQSNAGNDKKQPGAPGSRQGDQRGNQSKDGGKQQGGAAGQQGAGQKAASSGKAGGAGAQPGGSQGQLHQMRADQAALKQGLEQLGKNLSEAGQRSALVNREVGSALARANMSMDQTMKALETASSGNMPQKQAEQTLDALNRLALELLKNSQQIDQSENGTGLQQMLDQLAELAKQQGNLSGKSNSLLPLALGPKALSQQIGALAREQREIAQKLGGMNKGGARDDLLGRLDELVREADRIATDLEGGRMTQKTAQRQAELFHKLLDAGRTIEKDEVSDERKADAAQPLPPSVVRALRPGLFDAHDRYLTPSAEQLQDMPPAFRRLILEYFQKLNSTDKPAKEKR